MLTLGITGGIGSGKSLVCRMLSVLGTPIYDTDSRAKALYDADTELREAMIRLIGGRLYATSDGRLDRAYLGQCIFGNAELLRSVESLVHPAVHRDIVCWQEVCRRSGYRWVVVESALFAQSAELRALVDKLCVVTAPEEVRLLRAMGRDGVTADAIRARMHHQLSDEALSQDADYVLVNDGIAPLLPQVDRLVRQLSSG